MKKIIEIQEDTKIGEFILEKGDKVQLVNSIKEDYTTIQGKFRTFLEDNMESYNEVDDVIDAYEAMLYVLDDSLKMYGLSIKELIREMY